MSILMSVLIISVPLLNYHLVIWSYLLLEMNEEMSLYENVKLTHKRKMVSS